jgi:hypothetical protein
MYVLRNIHLRFHDKIEIDKLLTLKEYSLNEAKKVANELLAKSQDPTQNDEYIKYKENYIKVENSLKEKEESLSKVKLLVKDYSERRAYKANQGDYSEILGYPTQKPEGLIERIINASSNEGDLIGDFFCGSGTTIVVAEKLGRKWIGTDLGKFGIHTSRKRMVGVQRELKKDGKDFRAFEILNIGKYERESFLNTNDDLRAEEKAKQAERKEREFIKLILSAYKAEAVESFANIVGKKRDRLVAVGPINLPVSSKFIREIVDECKSKNLTKIDVLGFDYEMGMNFSEYADEGIDVAFKIIPREVFDKRAVELFSHLSRCLQCFKIFLT